MDRRMATPKRHYRDSAEREHIFLLGMTFIVGAMAGACITLGVVL